MEIKYYFIKHIAIKLKILLLFERWQKALKMFSEPMARYPNRIKATVESFTLISELPPEEGLCWEYPLPHPQGCFLNPETLKDRAGPYCIYKSGLNDTR